ncbi:MAG: DUF4249 family protein [Flavobacteriaceae bacterium]|jgi:hypothetical protein
MKRFILYTLIGYTLFGCEEVVQLDLDTAPARLVIDAQIKISENEESIQRIVLSLTNGFYEQTPIMVDDALVEIKEVDNDVVYTFSHDANEVGNYTSDFTPDPNTNYKLVINYDGEVYESSTEQLVPAVPIDNLTQGTETLFTGDEIEVLVTITDVDNRDDFYIFDFGFNNFLATKDEFYQGNEFTFSYFLDDLEAGDTAVISIYGADEAYFNFMTAVIEQTEEGGDPFKTTPSTVRGNIYNVTNTNHYPMGYFSIGEAYTSSILLE